MGTSKVVHRIYEKYIGPVIGNSLADLGFEVTSKELTPFDPLGRKGLGVFHATQKPRNLSSSAGHDRLPVENGL